MKRGSKRKLGQLKISFSMLFSIILIIAFLAVAIYAIKFFLDQKKCAEQGIFKQDLQEEINRAWSSDESSFVFSHTLSKSLDYVCFINSKEGARGNTELYNDVLKYGLTPETNMFYWPLRKACKDARVFSLEHIDIEKITEKENPYCIEVVEGKVKIKIEKGFSEDKVLLEKIFKIS